MPASSYKLALQHFQSDRLRRDHADLAAEQQYQALGEFFFTDMYGPRDFAARDEQAHRLHQFIHFAPALAVADVEQVLELLEVSNRLDDAVVAWLIALDAPLPFDEATYEHAYRLAENYDERVHQLGLIRSTLYNVHRIVRMPLIKLMLDNTERIAAGFGMADVHRFLRHGYQAIKPVKDIQRFVETVFVRERERLDRIYADHLVN